jgi:hypothetical protein
MLSVIEAFGMDRIEDGQVEATPALTAVLERIRRERDAACGRVVPGTPGDSVVDPAAADWVTHHAILTERALLTSKEPVGFTTYESIALAKQSAGLVAAVALARSAGWSPRRRLATRRTLESIALGLQMHDDVVDWEDDEARGGAWVVALVRGGPDLVQDPVALRSVVLRSGVLEVLLRRARWHFHAAALRARALGALRLASWARGRAERLSRLVDAESRSPGYAIRVHALSAWATEVLA